MQAYLGKGRDTTVTAKTHRRNTNLRLRAPRMLAVAQKHEKHTLFSKCFKI